MVNFLNLNTNGSQSVSPGVPSEIQTGGTLSSGVGLGQYVYNNAGVWTKALAQLSVGTPLGTGIVTSTSPVKVTTKGYLSGMTNLTPGAFHYAPISLTNNDTDDIISDAQESKWDIEDISNTIVYFQVDTANTSGHFEDTSNIAVSIDAGNTNPKVMSACIFKITGDSTIYILGEITGDGTANDAVVFDGTKATGTYALDWIRALNFVSDDLELSEGEGPGDDTSYLFDGSGDYLSIPDHEDWAFGSGDFTIDAWVYYISNSGDKTIFWTGVDQDNAMFWDVDIAAGMRFFSNNMGISFTRSWTPTTNTWYHLAITRNGSIWRFFVNGTQLGSNYTSSTTITDYSNPLMIGQRNSAGYLNGYLDEFRISKGIARWTSNFTPPTAQHVSDANTKLLIHGGETLTGANGSGATFTDVGNTGHTVTQNGNAQNSVVQFKNLVSVTYPLDYYTATAGATGEQDISSFPDVSLGRVTASGNSTIYASVSDDAGVTYYIFNTTGSVWRAIARNNGGAHEYNNNASNNATETWVSATLNNMQYAISEAVSSQAANRMTTTEYAAITEAQFDGLSGSDVRFGLTYNGTAGQGTVADIGLSYNTTILTTTDNNVKLGMAISSTEMILDPDVEGSAIATDYNVVTSDYGYFGGGKTTGDSNSVDRLTFSDSNIFANSSSLTQAKRKPSGFGDASTYGYFGGGFTGTYFATVDRLTFSSSNISANSSNLIQARYFLAGFGDSDTYGYLGGGYTGASVNTVDRLTFSSSNIFVNASSLIQARYRLAGFGDSSTYGYFGGGYTGTTGEVGAAAVNTVDRLTFSSSNISSNSSNLIQARFYIEGFGDSDTYGYLGGGYTGAAVNTVDRLTFSSSNISANSSNLIQARYRLAGFGDSSTYGYFGGGYTGASVNTVDRLTFSSSNIFVNASQITEARYFLAGLAMEL